MQLDEHSFAEVNSRLIHRHIKRLVEPLERRIAELENRPTPERGDPGQPGERGVGIAAAEKRDGVLILRLTDGSEKEVGAVDGAPGKDGNGIADLLVDRDGALVASFDDGRMKNLGPIVGKDGEPGKDGNDGFGLDDYDEWLEDDGRTLVRRYTRGEDFKEFRHQTVIPIYRGVFKDGTVYMKGDTVTWGGCMWHCNDATTTKPDDGPWTLATRKGRDGKDAK